MNELQIFENSEFGSVRTIDVNGKTYFVANDIAKALGYVETAKAVRTHCKGVSEMDIPSNGGIQKMKIIPEGDIYRLVIKSQLPTAEKFERWVFDEVLPSIRKHGMYAEEELLDNPDLLIHVAQKLKEEREKNKALKTENERMKPKEIFADAVSASHTSILVGDLAKLICQNGVKIGQKRLFRWLRTNGYLIKDGSSYNMPMQRYMEQGLFEVKENSVQNPDGSIRITKTTKVTGKGQIYFVNKFINNERKENQT